MDYHTRIDIYMSMTVTSNWKPLKLRPYGAIEIRLLLLL